MRYTSDNYFNYDQRKDFLREPLYYVVDQRFSEIVAVFKNADDADEYARLCNDRAK